MELLQELKARLAAVVAEYKKLFGKNNTLQTTTKTAAPPPKGNFSIKNAVGKDCKNDYLDVVTIQELLKKCGFYSGVIDGNYSIEIENAIKVAPKNSGNTQSAKIAGKND